MPYPTYGKWTGNNTFAGTSCETVVPSKPTPPPTPRHPRDLPDDNPSAKRLFVPKQKEVSLGVSPTAFLWFWDSGSEQNHKIPNMCG